VTKAERERIIREHEGKKRENLRARMSRLGRSRSAKKLRAVRQNIKVAQATRLGRIIDGVRPKRSKP